MIRVTAVSHTNNFTTDTVASQEEKTSPRIGTIQPPGIIDILYSIHGIQVCNTPSYNYYPIITTTIRNVTYSNAVYATVMRSAHRLQR